MARAINTARFPAGEVPEIRSMVYTTGQTFVKGAILFVAAAGTVEEVAADPTIAVGIALEGAGKRPGYDAANSPTVITGRLQEVSVAILNKTTVFSMTGSTAPLQTHVGASYGTVKVGAVWTIDISETTVLVWDVVDIDVDEGLFFCIANDAVLIP